jgi:hypothetical protein
MLTLRRPSIDDWILNNFISSEYKSFIHLNIFYISLLKFQNCQQL